MIFTFVLSFNEIFIKGFVRLKIKYILILEHWYVFYRKYMQSFTSCIISNNTPPTPPVMLHAEQGLSLGRAFGVTIPSL